MKGREGVGRERRNLRKERTEGTEKRGRASGGNGEGVDKRRGPSPGLLLVYQLFLLTKLESEGGM